MCGHFGIKNSLNTKEHLFFLWSSFLLIVDINVWPDFSKFLDDSTYTMLSTSMKWLDNVCQTQGPLAKCGPPSHIVWPAGNEFDTSSTAYTCCHFYFY